MIAASNRLSSVAPAPYDVIVTPCEVNNKHGTGILLDRIFGCSPHILSVRSIDYYKGEHSFGDVSINLNARNISRLEIFSRVLQQFQDKSVKRIICVPYRTEDVLIAIALKDIFNAPLCAYIMDDQNVYEPGIPNPLMEEFLTKASLRLAISPEMRVAYERKYNLKFFWLPPVIPHHLLQTEAWEPAPHYTQNRTGILVGNIWGQNWLEHLKRTIQGAGLKINWYGHKTVAAALNADPDALAAAGIVAHGFLPEPQLVPLLRDYPYAVIPTSSLKEGDDAKAIAKLSLLSRIPFIMATAGTPMLILGDRETAVARFVERFQVGMVCGYDPVDLSRVVEQITDPENQRRMRQNAIALAETFSALGMADWIWEALETGSPADERFEVLALRSEADLVSYIPPPPPRRVWRDFVPPFQALQRLQRQGFQPDFVTDVGASTGIWSDTMSHLFPDAQFVLVEPLWSQYDLSAREHYVERHPNFAIVEKALSDQPGKTQFRVSGDLYGSSLLNVGDFRDYKTIDVEITTLDVLRVERSLSGRGLLKIDVQCAEHLVLAGAQQFIQQVDVLILELSLVRYSPEAKIFPEMLQIVQKLGFRIYDDVGEWRNPANGTLLQKDYLFVREHLFVPKLRD
jgi:FkbM family methyltransferase